MSIAEKNAKLQKLQDEIQHEIQECKILAPHIFEMMKEAARLADELRRE